MAPDRSWCLVPRTWMLWCIVLMCPTMLQAEKKQKPCWQANKACMEDEVFQEAVLEGQVPFLFLTLYHNMFMVICCESLSSVVSLDIRHIYNGALSCLQIANSWLITVYSIHRGWFVISVNVGLVIALSLFIRPFLDKLLSGSCF